MRITLDPNPAGLLRANSDNTRRFVGPKLGPSATNTLATLVELADRAGGSTQVDTVQIAACVGLSTKGLQRALARLETFHVITRTGDELTVREWINAPTQTWREKTYPAELAAEFKTMIQSTTTARPTSTYE